MTWYVPQLSPITATLTQYKTFNQIKQNTVRFLHIYRVHYNIITVHIVIVKRLKFCQTVVSVKPHYQYFN